MGRIEAGRLSWTAAAARLSRRPWAVLVPVMIAASALILVAGDDTSFFGDDLYYFGRTAAIEMPPALFDAPTPEYLLAPHNGHLQIAGKLVYEAMFALVGANYTAFRVLEVLVVMLCVGLFFTLARRRVGEPVALLLSLLLCVFGAAWEALIWPFDVHTMGALAAGLGALLALERERGPADGLACALLIVSICFVELGVVFTVAAAVSVLSARSRRSRWWVFAIPAVLFAAWYLWARRYDVAPVGIENVADVIPAWFESLGAVLAALTGRFPTGEGVPATTIGLDAWTAALAALALVAFALRLRRGGLPPTVWPLIAAALGYWTLLGLADRAPDSSRYLFVGAVLVLLIGAELVRRPRPPAPAAVAAVALVVAVALPANVAKLFDGGEHMRADARLVGGEFAMFELAGDAAAPEYVAGYDLFGRSLGSSPFVVMRPPDYLAAAERIGSLADPLARVREADVTLRRVDDAVLSQLLGLRLAPSPALPRAECRRPAPGSAALVAPPGGVVVRALDRPITFSVSRFVPDEPIRELGTVEPGEWARIEIPGPDAAPDPWMIFFDRPPRVCAIG